MTKLWLFRNGTIAAGDIDDEALLCEEEDDTPVHDTVPTQINRVKHLSCDVIEKND